MNNAQQLRNEMARELGIEWTVNEAQTVIDDVLEVAECVQGTDWQWLRDADKSPGALYRAWRLVQDHMNRPLSFKEFRTIRYLILLVDEQVNPRKKEGETDRDQL